MAPPTKMPVLFPKQAILSHLPNFFGGDKRDRTADLLNAIQALSQLSYTPLYQGFPSQANGFLLNSIQGCVTVLLGLPTELRPRLQMVF